MHFQKYNPNPNLGKKIVDHASEYFFFFFFYANNSLVTKRMILKSIRWEKPWASWLTLNTKGSATSNSGSVGGGGLIKDEKSDWVIGFARKIRNTTSFMAELWAL